VEHQRVLLKLPLRPSGPVVRKIHQVPVGRDAAGQAVLGRDWAGLRMCQGVWGVGRYNKRVKILKHKNVLICLSDRSSSTLCRFLRRSSFKSSRNLYISQYCTVVWRFYSKRHTFDNLEGLDQSQTCSHTSHISIESAKIKLN
jgi:hypothetical protein